MTEVGFRGAPKSVSPGMFRQKPVVGWREIVELPDLGADGLTAKIDTGARSSALHVVGIEPFERRGKSWVRFEIDTASATSKVRRLIEREALTAGVRKVKSSNGEVEARYVIMTTLSLGTVLRRIELTLTNRKDMRYPMLVGRTALRSDFLVDPGRSFLLGRDTVTRRPSRTKQ